jgi:hypothetical protein
MLQRLFKKPLFTAEAGINTPRTQVDDLLKVTHGCSVEAFLPKKVGGLLDHILTVMFRGINHNSIH